MSQELRKVGHQEIADTDRPRASFRVDALEGTPGFEPQSSNRPMDEVEINVVEAEPLKAGIECVQRAIEALILVPELGRDEHFFARYVAVSNSNTDVGF